MRIAFVTGDAPWPATAGGRLRDAATFEALGSVGDVTLVSFPFLVQPDHGRLPAGARIHPMPWPRRLVKRIALRAMATIRRRHPFQQHLVLSGARQQLAGDIAQLRPDVVVVGYPLYDALAAAARDHAPYLVVDLTEMRGAQDRGVETGLLDRVRGWLDRRVLLHVELSVARYADEVWFVTARDAQMYASATGISTRVVPNTVDVASYSPYRTVTPQRHHFAFLGAFDNVANRRAAERLARKILPLTRRHHPDAELVLIGRRAPRGLQRLVARTAGASLHADAEDALAVLAEHAPLVAPLESGSGTKLKLLEAAAAGIPIVTTNVGLAGLGYQPGRELLVADDDDGLAAAIAHVWRDPDSARVRAAAALARTVAEYDRSVARVAIRAALARVPAASRERGASE